MIKWMVSLILMSSYCASFSIETFGKLFGDIEERATSIQNEIRANFAPTLWCGVRNAAPFPEALSAIYPHLDSCCRSHDQVLYILQFGSHQ